VGRRSSFGRPRRSSGISRDWSFGPGTGSPVTISVTGSFLMGAALVPTAGELTVMRTRGLFDIFLQTIPAADGDGFAGAVGIGKTTLKAFTAGIASMPVPLGDMEWDGWMWHSFFSVHMGETAGVSGGVEMSQRIEVDSKAMRKFDDQEVLYAAVEVVETGSAVAIARLDCRMLLQDSGS